ncbi:MAG: hypothetical protein QFB87_02015 [Patescibacteria group bacterium]|nr:hypothetical protein [Patescibacteria group bacterium]
MKYYIKIALQHYAMGLIIPIAIIWKLQNGLTLPQAVFTEAIVLLVTAIVDLPAGLIANVINNKRSLVLGALLHLLGMILLAAGSSFSVFFIAAIFTGAAWAFVSGADEAYIHDDYIENSDEYKKVFSSSVIIDELFTIIGMVSASLLIYLGLNLRILFIIASGLLFVHFLYAAIFLPSSKLLLATRVTKATRLVTLGFLRNKVDLPIIFVMLAFAVVYEGLRPLWQPHMQSIGIDIASFGLIFAGLKLASLAGSIMARYRSFHKRDIAITFLIMLVSFISFGTSITVVSLIALCMYLFSENYFRIYMSTVLNEMITSNRAAVLSLGSVIRNGAGALIIVFAGFISSSSIALAFFVVAIIKLPAMFYVLRAHLRQRD